VRLRSLLLIALCALASGPADAGHELSFYPSYYPQEIRIETHPPAAAAALLQKSTLHAYVGGDPFAGAATPPPLASVESLAGYVILTFDPAQPAGRDAVTRCTEARALLPGLATDVAGYAFHPYPVTPRHADYLQHADLAQVARTASGATASSLRVRPVGRVAERLVAGRAPAPDGLWDATLEALPLDELLGSDDGAPWMKEGWFHAYRLLAPAIVDPARRRDAAELERRLTTGGAAGPVERLNLERALVRLLLEGCERVVVGYLIRREVYTTEFSEGIENVAADSQAGLDSAIFVRTVKLKDFPWNGWLRLGVPALATAAWNPAAGFTDPTGRLIWSALGDPPVFPAPGSATWIGNRVTVASVTPVTEVPEDALLPEPGTGILRRIGPAGRPAAVKIVYRVLASPFHDGTRMGVADTLYALGFAYRWGAPGGPLHDPAVEAATARLRDWLAGVKVLSVDASEREFGEVKFTTIVQTIEVYGRYRLADDLQTAAIAPPWSPVPWTVLTLSEAAVSGKLAAFSADEARRLAVPWLDLARDQRVKGRLAGIVNDSVLRGDVPADLSSHVSHDEAQARWVALRDFYRQHDHFLVTNGPYQLGSWSDDAVVLAVFRDFSYPLGVGSYDRYPIPLRAYPARVDVTGGRVEVQADVDVVEKFQREFRISRQPLRTANVEQPDLPRCRYVAIAADGRVAAAGEAPYAGKGAYALDLGILPTPGRYTVSVALVVRDNWIDPEIRTLAVGQP
jgi:hypothetical protein